MPKNITRVRWSASGLPWGVSFDEQTGTFSGTPDTAGEYTVPVTVETNYGKDTKDVLIDVIETYPIYAIGKRAEQWSENAEPDECGFRKLKIPNASCLQSLYCSFSAKTGSGEWYLGSSLSDGTVYAVPDYSFTTPKKYPIEGIDQMVGGYTAGTDDGSGVYFTYTLKDGSPTDEYKDGVSQITTLRRKLKLSEDFCSSGYSFIQNYEGKLRHQGFGISPGSLYEGNIEDIKKIGGTKGQTRSPNLLILEKSGNLLCSGDKGIYSLDSILEPFKDENGDVKGVKDFWFGDWWDTFFILFEDNELYARGANTYCQIGLSSEVDTSPAHLYRIGNFNVKKICQPFLLTEDGELYHSGTFSTSHRMYIEGVPSHTEFTRIFPEYTFADIAVPYNTKTLIVTMKE